MIIGRDKEKQLLIDMVNSKEAEFIAVCGEEESAKLS